MPLRGLRLSFVGKGVVIDTIAEVIAGERIVSKIDMTVLGPSVIVFDMKHHFSLCAVHDSETR